MTSTPEIAKAVVAEWLANTRGVEIRFEHSEYLQSLIATALVDLSRPAEPEGHAYAIVLIDEAIGALDKETYEDKRRADFDAPDDQEWVVTAGTCRAIERALEEARRRLSRPTAVEAVGRAATQFGIDLAQTLANTEARVLEECADLAVPRQRWENTWDEAIAAYRAAIRSRASAPKPVTAPGAPADKNVGPKDGER